MVSYLKIEEYVALCHRALSKKTPLEQIGALSRAKKIMRDDLVLYWTNIKVSSNWIKWWWYAVDCVHGDYHGNVRYFVEWDKPINFENFMEWVDCLDNSMTMYNGLRSEHDIGPGCEHEEIGYGNEPDKWMDFPETYVELNKQYPLLPTERKPIVTALDMVFRELLWVWTRAVRRLLRDAVVDGEAENAEDAEPPEYMTDNAFIDNLEILSQTPQYE